MGVKKGVSETKVQLTLTFLGAELLACVVIPGCWVSGTGSPTIWTTEKTAKKV